MRKADHPVRAVIAAPMGVLMVLVVSCMGQARSPRGQPADEGTLAPAKKVILRLEKPSAVLAKRFGKHIPVNAWPGAAEFSPRGDILALDTSGEAVLWDVKLGKKLRTLGKEWGWLCLVFSPDGRQLATIRNGNVFIYSTVTGARERQINTVDKSIEVIRFGPEGKKLFSGGRWSPVRVWDVATGKLLKEHQGHGEAWRVAFSPDGTVYAVVRPWFPPRKWGLLRREIFHRMDSSKIFHRVELWSLDTGKKLKALAPVKGWYMRVGFTPDGRYVATGSESGLTIWEVTTGKLLPGYDTKNPGCGPPLLVVGGGWILVSNGKRGIRFHKLGTRRVAEVSHAGPKGLRILAVAPDGRTVLGIHPPANDPHNRLVCLWRLKWPATKRGVE